LRCYFHLTGPDEELLDDVGIEVASVEEARTEALKAVAELRREQPELQRDWNGWQLKIVGDEGEVLSVVRLTGVGLHRPAQRTLSGFEEEGAERGRKPQ
jgi:hypothetical protein